MTRYDFIVIGTGAGGGTLVNKLARSGAKILVLERGDFVPREAENWSAKAVFTDNRYVSRDTWLLNGKLSQPGVHYNVGGATKFYGAALYRLRPGDFSVVFHTDGVSPAWPVSYRDMEPWYTAAEHMYHVHGHHGEDPTEGYASADYPWPALPHSPRIQRLSDDLAAAGYHPFHAPCAVGDDSSANPCIRCGSCDGHPCMIGAKSDAETMGIGPVLHLPNVTLVTNCEVTEMTASDGRRVDAVYAVLHGGPAGPVSRWFTAGTVILAAGAANTAKILLRSNLANSSDEVGRNYMFHNSRAVLAIDRHPNWTTFQKTLGLNDFYWRYGNIQMVGKSNLWAMRSEKPKLTALAPDMSLAEIAAHSVDFWLTTEDLPLPQNRVTLAAGGNIALSYTRTNQAEADGLYRELRTILNTTGMTRHHVLDRHLYAGNGIGLAGVAHQAGTCRMGDDPRASVVDADLKAHDLENLYVCDASVFPSIGAVNPALTVMALACRLGNHLVEG